MSSRLFRRAASAAVLLLLVAPLALGDGAAVAASTFKATSPGQKAGTWLASQVNRGRIHNGQFDFDDWGLTIDAAFALVATGRHHKVVHNMTAAIERHYFKDYATFSGDKFAGAMAKSLVAAEVLGKRPRKFGGHDVRAQVLGLIAPHAAGFEFGRIRDTGPTDYSNTFAQSYAAIGLARSGRVPPQVVGYLLKQQCSNGYFRLTEVAGETCNQSGSAPDVDATALAIQALVAAKAAGAAFPAGSVRRAVGWLTDAQRENGAWSGGTTTAGPNTNSTGLAVQGLRAAPGKDPGVKKAVTYVRGLQLTKRNAHGPAAKDIGAIAYNRAALKKALDNGVQKVERDQFRRATAQAIFALIRKPLTTLQVS